MIKIRVKPQDLLSLVLSSNNALTVLDISDSLFIVKKGTSTQLFKTVTNLDTIGKTSSYHFSSVSKSFSANTNFDMKYIITSAVTGYKFIFLLTNITNVFYFIRESDIL